MPLFNFLNGVVLFYIIVAQSGLFCADVSLRKHCVTLFEYNRIILQLILTHNFMCSNLLNSVSRRVPFSCYIF